MAPVLAQLGPFKLYGFGLMLALAFTLGLLWATRRAERRLGVNSDRFSVWLIVAIIIALIGARLLYIVFFPDLFFANPLGTLLAQGGLVWYGGMAAFIAMLALMARRFGVRFLALGDVMALPAGLGLAIGRIGCLLAGCCYGAACNLPWAITYPAGHETYPHAVHPAPLYESFGLALMLAAIAHVKHHHPQKLPTGRVSAIFLIGYGILRFLVEYIRGDRLVWLDTLNLSASQLISLVVVGAGVFIWWWTLKHPIPFQPATTPETPSASA